MTKAEIRRAAKDGTLELGAHTRSHPALNTLTPEAQREEILSGKRLLESAAGMPVRAFAYPYGSPWDVSLTTVQLAREAGFTTACANTPATGGCGERPFLAAALSGAGLGRGGIRPAAARILPAAGGYSAAGMSDADYS